MNIFKTLSLSIVIATALLPVMSSCNDSKSYAERLSDETKAVNYFLCDHKVINELPEDNNFIEGDDAPFYRLDEEGNIYMQVLQSGDRENNMAEDDELLFFRYTRYSLLYYHKYGEMYAEGNSVDVNGTAASFRFNNTTLSSSTIYGSGIQMPLQYLGVDCRVNIIIKSQYGFTSEIAGVCPYYYENLRYFRPKSN